TAGRTRLVGILVAGFARIRTHAQENTCDSAFMDRRKFFGGLIAAAWGTRTLSAGELKPGKTNEDQVNAIMNLLKQTAGGKQFWADVWFFRDWRIQSNSLTGH